MAKAFFAFLAVLGFGVFAGSVWLQPPLECQLLTLTQIKGVSAPPERYCGKPRAQLESFWERLDEERQSVERKIGAAEADFEARMMALSAKDRAQRSDAIIEEPEYLKDLRRQHANIVVEQNDIRSALRVHDLRIGLVGAATGAAGTLLLLLNIASSALRRRGDLPSRFGKSIDVKTVERWLDPDRAEVELSSLYPDRKAAIRQLWDLRPKRCGYCDKPLPFEPPGRLDHVLLLKKAPGDVKTPKRIPLGDGYRPIPPETIVCGDCGHAHKL